MKNSNITTAGDLFTYRLSRSSRLLKQLRKTANSIPNILDCLPNTEQPVRTCIYEQGLIFPKELLVKFREFYGISSQILSSGYEYWVILLIFLRFLCFPVNILFINTTLSLFSTLSFTKKKIKKWHCYLPPTTHIQQAIIMLPFFFSFKIFKKKKRKKKVNVKYIPTTQQTLWF